MVSWLNKSRASTSQKKRKAVLAMALMASPSLWRALPLARPKWKRLSCSTAKTMKKSAGRVTKALTLAKGTYHESGRIFAGSCQSDQYAAERVEAGTVDSMPEQQIGQRNQRGHCHIQHCQAAEIDNPGAERQTQGCQERDGASKGSAPQRVDAHHQDCTEQHADQTRREENICRMQMARNVDKHTHQ